MPFRKVRTLQELEDSLWREPGPALWNAIERVWRFSTEACPRHFPPGVHKHRSLEEAQALRDLWDQRDFELFWERQRAAGIEDPRHR